MKLCHKILTCAFVVAEGILWLCILRGGGANHSLLCYSSILLAFLFSFLGIWKRKESMQKEVWFLIAGLFTTVLADYCLVVCNPIERVWGMVFFCLTQTCYFLFLLFTQENKGIRKANVISHIALALILPCAAFLVLGKGTDLLAILSVIYFAFLLCNIVFSKVGVKGGWLLFIGLISFSLCDIMVGLGVLCELYLKVSETSFLYRITHLPIDMIWFFYVPSQTLISLFATKFDTSK